MITNKQPREAADIGYALVGDGPEHVLVMHDWNGDRSTYDAVVPYLDGAHFTGVAGGRDRKPGLLKLPPVIRIHFVITEVFFFNLVV